MKTKINSKKTISSILIACLFLSQHMLAQKQRIEAEQNSITGNATYLLSILFFMLGFAILIALKLRDNNKPTGHKNQQQQHARHRNRYGSRHQYNH